MFVFVVANLPLPVIIYLNARVTWRYLQVRKLARNRQASKPERFVLGWWLNMSANLFIYTPIIVERRIFVQHHYWLISYAIAAVLSISGLVLMNSGLGEELAELKAATPGAKPVDTLGSDRI